MMPRVRGVVTSMKINLRNSDLFYVKWEDGVHSFEKLPGDTGEITFVDEPEEQTLADYIASISRKYEDEDKVQVSDNINSPKHYMLFPEYGIQVRDVCRVMAEKLQAKGYSGFFISDYVQMLQYILRFQDKNGKEDIEKTQWYLNKMLEQLQEKESL